MAAPVRPGPACHSGSQRPALNCFMRLSMYFVHEGSVAVFMVRCCRLFPWDCSCEDSLAIVSFGTPACVMMDRFIAATSPVTACHRCEETRSTHGFALVDPLDPATHGLPIVLPTHGFPTAKVMPPPRMDELPQRFTSEQASFSAEGRG